MGLGYTEYLQSAEWRELRRIVFRRDANRCRLCDSPDNLHCHHRTYERFGHELTSDLTTLCGACHDRFHLWQTPHERFQAYQNQVRTETLALMERALLHLGAGAQRMASELIRLDDCAEADALTIQFHGRMRQIHQVESEIERLSCAG